MSQQTTATTSRLNNDSGPKKQLNFVLSNLIRKFVSMKGIAVYIIVIAVALCSGACRHDSHITDELLRADGLMYCAPDSALSILDSLDTSHASEEQQAHHALLLTKARYKNYLNETDDSLITIAEKYYSGRTDSLEMQSLFLKGFVLKNKHDLRTALIMLMKAAELARNNRDWYFTGLCFRTQAEIYSYIIAYDPQLEAALKAIDAFEKAGATEFALWEHTTAARALIFIDPERSLSHLSTVRNSEYFKVAPAIQSEYYEIMTLALQASGDYRASADSIATACAKGLVTSPVAIANMAMTYANAGSHGRHANASNLSRATSGQSRAIISVTVSKHISTQLMETTARPLKTCNITLQTPINTQTHCLSTPTLLP